MQPDWDVVILGGGPAGLGAAVYSATEGLRTLIVEPRSLGGQAAQSARIDNYLGFPNGISGKQLTDRAIKQVKRYGGVHWQDKAVALGVHADLENSDITQLVQLESGKVVTSASVVLTLGVQYRKLSIPGVNSFGVFYGANPHEAGQWGGKKIAVVGGANSAGQCVAHYAGFCSDVYLLVRGAQLDMSHYLVERIAGNGNVAVQLETQVVEINGKGNCLTLHLSDGRELEVDGLFLFIGADPHTQWVKEQGVMCDAKGFILSGLALARADTAGVVLPHETSRVGVFTAGDVRQGTVKRVASAVGDGAAVVSEIHQYLRR